MNNTTGPPTPLDIEPSTEKSVRKQYRQPDRTFRARLRERTGVRGQLVARIAAAEALLDATPPGDERLILERDLAEARRRLAGRDFEPRAEDRTHDLLVVGHGGEPRLARVHVQPCLVMRVPRRPRARGAGRPRGPRSRRTATSRDDGNDGSDGSDGSAAAQSHDLLSRGGVR